MAPGQDPVPTATTTRQGLVTARPGRELVTEPRLGPQEAWAALHDLPAARQRQTRPTRATAVPARRQGTPGLTLLASAPSSRGLVPPVQGGTGVTQCWCTGVCVHPRLP